VRESAVKKWTEALFSGKTPTVDKRNASKAFKNIAEFDQYLEMVLAGTDEVEGREESN